MCETINFKNIQRKQKIAQGKEWFNRKVRDVSCWFYNNKEMIMFLGPTVIGLATTVIKVTGKRINLGKEQRLKEHYCYDRSLGHYWALRRELSNHEWIEIDRRKANGERLADILSELKVLK